jgi:hypothetical protein
MLCIDLVGPYTMGKDSDEVKLHCLTMIDPATGWFEIVEIPNRHADYISNFLERTWLTCYPWPTQVVLDRGSEFQAELSVLLKNEYRITKKVITTRNPQANSMVERVHQVIHQLIRTISIKGKTDLDKLYFGWNGVMSAVRRAVRSTIHTTQCATPTQLVFGRDAILNVAFEADWQYIKERRTPWTAPAIFPLCFVHREQSLVNEMLFGGKIVLKHSCVRCSPNGCHLFIHQ